MRFWTGGDGYYSRFLSGVQPWLGSGGVGDRSGFVLITMGRLARDGVVGLGLLPVSPEGLGLLAYSNRGSFSLRGKANSG